MAISRRSALGWMGLAAPATLLGPATRLTATEPLGREPHVPPLPPGGAPKTYDVPGLEWVMDIVPICSDPEFMGDKADQVSADGDRYDVWPLIGGFFRGRGIKGTIIPGGGDFPVIRPDGVVVVDALYRLKNDDGVQIIIHNKGYGYTEDKYRLVPTFNVPGKKYGWLRESIFVGTLSYPVPAAYGVKEKAGENGRLIQVYRLV